MKRKLMLIFLSTLIWSFSSCKQNGNAKKAAGGQLNSVNQNLAGENASGAAALRTPFDYGATEDPATHLAAIQAALNHGGVFIPGGTTWIVDGQLAVKSSTSIKGEGASSIIKTTRGDISHGLIRLNDDAEAISISDISFIGPNSRPTESMLEILVYGRRNKNFRFTNNLVKGFSGGTVNLTTATEPLITNNNITDARAGHVMGADISLINGSKNYIISNNIIGTDLNSSISVGSNGSDLYGVISNNVINISEKSLVADQGILKRHGIMLSYGTQAKTGKLVVSGNVISNTNWTGIYSIGFGSELLIDSNVVENTAKDMTSEGLKGGIAVLVNVGAGPRKVTISNNIVSDVFNYTAATIAGIAYQDRDPDSHALITGNTVERAAVGIVIINGKNFHISNNSIIESKSGILIGGNSSGYSNGDIYQNTILQSDKLKELFNKVGPYNGIRIDKGTNELMVQVKDNRLENTLSDATDATGLSLRKEGMALSGNFIKGYSKAFWFQEDIRARATKQFIVKNNIIENCNVGYSIRGGQDSLFVSEGTTFINVTLEHENRYLNTMKIGYEGRLNGETVELFSDEIPTLRGSVFVIGDRVTNRNIKTGAPTVWGYDGVRWLAGPLF